MRASCISNSLRRIRALSYRDVKSASMAQHMDGYPERACLRPARAEMGYELVRGGNERHLPEKRSTHQTVFSLTMSQEHEVQVRMSFTPFAMGFGP